VESRGFSSDADRSGTERRFRAVRKPNKLPYDTISASYELEYGTDTLEIHTDAIRKGDRVLIHDDVRNRYRQAVANWWRNWAVKSSSNFLMELGFLNGREN
jgi:adenine phosphoribosyltransferase